MALTEGLHRGCGWCGCRVRDCWVSPVVTTKQHMTGYSGTGSGAFNVPCVANLAERCERRRLDSSQGEQARAERKKWVAVRRRRMPTRQHCWLRSARKLRKRESELRRNKPRSAGSGPTRWKKCSSSAWFCFLLVSSC